jgi:hypothetical protein
MPGSYRALFSTMPPLANSANPDESAVLAYIAEKLAEAGKDPSKAASVFTTIRRPERGILVFDRTAKTWKGVNHVA